MQIKKYTDAAVCERGGDLDINTLEDGGVSALERLQLKQPGTLD